LRRALGLVGEPKLKVGQIKIKSWEGRFGEESWIIHEGELIGTAKHQSSSQ
jgi:hypothetical protein